MIYGLEESLKKEELNKLKRIKEFSKKAKKDPSEFNVAKHHKGVLKMFKKDNTGFIYFIMLVIVLIASFLTVSYMYKKHLESPYIQQGIFVKDVNISGLTKEEALTRLDNELGSKMKDCLVLEYKNIDYYLAIEQFDAGFDFESSVDYAYNIGRTGDFVTDVTEFINVYFSNINIEPNLEYSEEELDRYLENIETKLPDQLEQSDYYLEDDELIIVNGKIGAGIFYDDLKLEIVDSLKDMSYSNIIIDIPTYEKHPEPIDLAYIHDNVYTEPENAYFTTEPYAVYPEVTGVDFSMDSVQALIDENPMQEEYVIKLDYYTPDITTDDLGMEAFPDLLATYSTTYDSSNTNRTTNLRLASNIINGTVIMPGEVFSYNKVVGKRTIAAGYKNAAIFSDGQVVDGLGGGICQVSSTLYNTALFADMTITSRTNHMFVPSYVKAGRDATVVWGAIDFKFRNDRNYPIKIESSVSGGVCTVSFYGLRRETEYDIKVETDYIRAIKYTTKYDYNSNKKAGTVLQGGVNGSVVDAYRVYYLNGNYVKREKLSRDTYDAQAKIVAR